MADLSFEAALNDRVSEMLDACTRCGKCVEACPVDAIRMDTYVHPRIWGFDRKDFIEDKEVLMHRSEVLASKGREGNMEELQEWYRQQDEQVFNPMRPELKTYTERGRAHQPWEESAEPAAIEALPRHTAAGR